MLGKNTLIQSLSLGVSALISFLILSLSARVFGPTVLGEVTYLISLTGFYFIFSDLGFSRAHVHYTAALADPGRTLGTFLPFKILLLLFSALAAIGASWFLGKEIGFLFLIVLGWQFLANLAEAISITFEGLEKSIPQNLTKLAAKFIRLAAVAVLAVGLPNSFGYGLTYLSESLFLAVIFLIIILRFKNFSFSRPLLNKYIAYSLPFWVIVPLGYLQDNGLVVILKNLSSVNEVGYYSGAANLSGFIKTLTAVVIVFFFPRISSLFQKHDWHSIQVHADLVIRYSVIIFMPAFIAMFLLRQEIVGLVLGPQFNAAAGTLGVLLLGVFVLTIVNPYDYILYATKNQRQMIGISAVTLLITLLSGFWLISPVFGLGLGSVGAAWANLIAWTVSGAGHLWLIKKYVRLKVLTNFFPLVIPAAVVMFGGSLIISFLDENVIFKVLVAAVLILIYYVYLAVVKIISIKDVKYIYDSFSQTGLWPGRKKTS